MRPLRFINEPIDVVHERTPLFEKKPGCPAAFSWRNEKYVIRELLSEWHDYQRRGRMARNMEPVHAKTAEGRGSWGVGQDYYQVRTKDGRIFELYYDRAPKEVDRRKGSWFLYRELTDDDE